MALTPEQVNRNTGHGLTVQVMDAARQLIANGERCTAWDIATRIMGRSASAEHNRSTYRRVVDRIGHLEAAGMLRSEVRFDKQEKRLHRFVTLADHV